MGKAKINRVKLSRMLRDGKSQKDIARAMGVSEAAISKAKKELNLAVVKSVSLESAHKIVETNLDTIAQLLHVNEVANQLLDELTGEDHIINRMVQAVQAFIEFEANPTKDNSKHLKTIIKMVNSEKNTAIKACDQILKQLNFQLEIYKTLYDLKAIQEFQQEVLNTIAEVSPKVRNDIIKRLKERRALRPSVSIN
jgi:uncharacterized protein YerC